MPLNVPKTVTAGLSTKWLASHPDYNSQDYNLIVAIAGAEPIATVTTPQGGEWLVEVDGADTADLDPGPYYWDARVVDGDSLSYPVGSGVLRLTPNLATVDTPYDGRSPSQKILDDLIVAFGKMSAGAIASYSIEGRNATYRSLEELTTAINYWKRQVRLEQAEQDALQGKPSSRTAKVRFSL